MSYNDILAAAIALQTGQIILDEILKGKPLENNYKKYFDKYCKQIDRDVKLCKEEGMSTEDLEFERMHVECVFLWLQENKIKLRK